MWGVCVYCSSRVRWRASLGTWVRDPAPNAGSVEHCRAAPIVSVSRGGRTASIRAHKPLDLTDPDNVRSYLEAP